MLFKGRFAIGLGASLLVPCVFALVQALAPDNGGTRIGERETPASEEAAGARLKELLPLWAASARRYEHHALRFLCMETHRTIDYSRASGEARKEKEIPYGYLLTRAPRTATYQVVRQVLDEQKRPTGGEKTLDTHCPEPYAWTFLFLPTTASTMRFHYLGREIQNYRLTHVVRFEGAASHLEGKDVREWTGAVWIEENTGSLVRVEARPNFQQERMRALWQEFQQAFMLPFGLRTKTRPHGYALALLFNEEREGLLLPSRLDLADVVTIATNAETLDTRLVLTYEDYRFFKIESEETIDSPGSR